MAKRYAIVPESWLQRLKAANEEQKSMNAEIIKQAVDEPRRQSPVFIKDKEENKQADPLEQYIDMLPKNQRTKGRILLQLLRPFVKLDEHQRVIYSPESTGSNIFDLIRYFTWPVKSVCKPRRPIDIAEFSRLIKAAGIPESAVAEGRCEEKKQKWERPWIHFDDPLSKSVKKQWMK